MRSTVYNGTVQHVVNLATHQYDYVSVADLGILKGGQAVGGPGSSSPGGKFEIYDVFQANLPEFLPASNHQESYGCE